MSSLQGVRVQCARCLRRYRARATSTTLVTGNHSTGQQRPNSLFRNHQPEAGPSRLRTLTPIAASLRSGRRYATKASEPLRKKRKIDMEDFPPERIRNLSIIAHIDHGKSTLADRLLQMTDTLPSTSNPQFLDKLKVERERGITVKAQTVSIILTHTDGKEYLINLIDTPGHVDFSYEVSRSLGACEGGLLLVDSTQGIQAQTLSVFHVAQEANLTLLPVINKVDLQHASPVEVSEQIAISLGLEQDKHMMISAKSGLGVDEVLRQIVDGLPPPQPREDDDGRLRALVFDTHYDHFRGVVSLVRIFSGSVRKGDKVRFIQADRKYEVLEIGIYNPEEVPVETLKEGQVGYLVCSMRNSDDAFIGDTICIDGKPVEPLPGFKPMKAMVYAGVFPADTADFNRLEEAIDRLTCNDRSVTVQRESSAALSQGFRLGFLGTLHMDVFRQRLEDEYSSEVIITAPTVPYKVTFQGGREAVISNPAEFPEVSDAKTRVVKLEEPMVNATIFLPNEYIGDMMNLATRYRGTQLEYRVLETTGRAILRYSFPLAEIVTDFFSELKSASSGFASFDYEEAGYEVSNLVKLNILLNGNAVDALAMIVHRDAAQLVGRSWCKKMKEVVPKQLFELAIQAAIGSKVVARESLPALRKDVTAGLYGGHYERKLKHLNKQKEGKKRLKRLAGNIDVPQSAFFEVLSSRPRSFSTCAPRQATRHDLPIIDPITPFLPHDFPSPPPRMAISSPDQFSLTPYNTTTLERCTRLSKVYKLANAPRQSTSADELYSAYNDLVLSESRSHILTSDEIRDVVTQLHGLYKDENRQKEDVDNRVAAVMNEFRLVESNAAEIKGFNLREATWRARTQRGVEMEAILPLEQRLLRSTPSSEDSAWIKTQWMIAVHHLLYLLAKVPNPQAFEIWWQRRIRVDNLSESHAYLARIILLENTKQVDLVPTVLRQGLDRAKGPDDRIVLVNKALYILATHQRWDIAGPMYAQLHSFTHDNVEVLASHPYPLNTPSSKSAELVLPDDLLPTQATYSGLLHALAFNGHIQAAITVLSHMIADHFTPTVADYASLFKGFARYGEIPPGPPGEAVDLFPSGWQTYVPVSADENQPNQRITNIWSRGTFGHGGENDENLWTYTTLRELWDHFIRLEPKPNARSSPSERQVWDIMVAFGRTTNGDLEVLRRVWEGMKEKFREPDGDGDGWRGVWLKGRLERFEQGLYYSARKSFMGRTFMGKRGTP